MVTLHAALLAVALTGAGQNIMLDFYADWCGPCRAMSPTVDALIAAGYPVQRVNLDQSRALAAQYGVQRIPCFVMLVDGREVDRVNEPTTYSRLERMCKLGAAAPPPAPAPSSPLMRAQEPTPPAPGPVAEATPAGFAVPLSVTVPAEPATGSGNDMNNALMVSQGAPPDWPGRPVPSAAAATGSDAALIAASVRLRVEDPTGRSCGSGTIVDSRSGEALVLTCGHIFRDSQGKGKIEVDLFTNPPQVIVGRLVSYDLTRDVGLVAIRPAGPVAAARLAPAGYRIAERQAVVSVGCNNGGEPTARHSQINRLNGFQGAPNIEVSGQPVEGRSGGGLFTSEGYVIGVCNAADPTEQQGLFVALEAICAQLDQDQLAFVYKSPEGGSDGRPAGVDPAGVPPVGPPPGFGTMPGRSELAAAGGLPAHEQAALDEIRRSLRDGAEVVVVVRPRGKPDARSEVVVLDHCSPEFLKQLAAEQRSPGTGLPVSRESSKPQKKWLEWSAPAAGPTPNPAWAGGR